MGQEKLLQLSMLCPCLLLAGVAAATCKLRLVLQGRTY